MSRAQRSDKVLVLLLLSMSVLLNILLVPNVHTLKNSYTIETRRNELKQHEKFVGEKLPPLTGLPINGAGAPAPISYTSNMDTIVYVLSPTCHFCAQNMENMRSLELHTRGRYGFIGLTLDNTGMDAFIRSNKIDFPIIGSIPSTVSTAYGLAATPETLLVSPDGTIKKIWQGAYSPAMVSEINYIFDVKLPGLHPIRNN